MRWARYVFNPPFSRRVRLDPQTVVSGAAPIARAVARANRRDALCGALDVLLSAYANDLAGARQTLDGLAEPRTQQELRALFERKNLRKVFIACFRAALAGQGLEREQAKLLLDFAAQFDDAYRKTFAPSPEDARGLAEPPPAPIEFPYARTSAAPGLRVVLLFESNMVAPGPRNHDLGDRIQSAFVRAGIDCRLLLPHTDAEQIPEADLIILNEDALFPRDEARKREQVARIRKRARKFVRLIGDPWGHWLEPSLKDRAHFYDFLWTLAPSMRAREAELGRPIWLIPFPTGFDDVFATVPSVPAEPRMSFVGAVEDYNLVRYYWLLFGLTLAPQIGVTVTSQRYDGLPVGESLRRYLDKLLATRACLNLTMRATGQRIVIHRGFDILKGGRLLVQEYAADVRHYLTPGRHFLEFHRPEDLARINETLGENDGHAAIVRQGAEFFRARYSDDAIVRHILTWL